MVLRDVALPVNFDNIEYACVSPKEAGIVLLERLPRLKRQILRIVCVFFWILNCEAKIWLKEGLDSGTKSWKLSIDSSNRLLKYSPQKPTSVPPHSDF